MGNCLNRTAAGDISVSVGSSNTVVPSMMSNRLEDALYAIENNITSFKEFRIGQHGHIDQPNRDHFSRLGSAIARNTHITLLVLNNGYCLDDVDRIVNSGFFEGLKRNSSIHRVMFHCGHHIDVIHETLKAYKENNNLTYLNIDNARIVSAAYPVLHLAETLRCCTNLKHINFENCRITDEQLLPMVDAVRGHELLEKLLLSENSIGDAGCEVVATLLEDPSCNLQVLDLSFNTVSSGGARCIAKSLSKNNQLQKLYLNNNRMTRPSPILQGVVSRVLCDTSSINNTHSSNHTMEEVFLFVGSEKPTFHIITKILKLNKGTNKSHVAIKKILKYHSNIDLSTLYDWDSGDEWTLKALPYVVGWFDKARDAVVNNDDEESYNIDTRTLSAIYQFARAMPLMFVPSSHIKAEDKKRKRIDNVIA